MRFGLALPQFDYSVPRQRPLHWSTMLELARRAEALGFDSLWLADHLFLSLEKYGSGPTEFGCFDPLVTLGALAQATARVRLGTLVLGAPLRPPTVLAKALATIDVLSEGRLVVGMGAGWYEPEFVAAGVTFERASVRLEQLSEAVQIVRGLMEGGPFSFNGRHYRAEHARCLPPALQRPSPPIWVGGKGDRLLEVCARYGDGWNTVWSWTLGDYRARSAVLDATCERVGRDPVSVIRSVGLYALAGEDETDLRRRYERLQSLTPPGVINDLSLREWRTGHLVGTVEQVRDQIGAWASEGVQEIVLGAGAVPFAVTAEDDIELLAAACSLRGWG